MPLQSGATLGSYTVAAKIGEGGMGEVYRARDTKLDRDVALKVLPPAFTDDPDRLARFEREAKVLASLSHPNIGGIHGLEESEGTKALVLEYIDGPTLADKIAQGPVPVDEALTIAKQIADALEAAHEAGIIHRDLKPANIKLKSDGTVKVLDFGLAKAVQPEAGDQSLSQSPTMSLTAAATQMGMVIGTAAYMAPEQAKGLPVDKRADIWAFGAVFFEMLTGRRPFVGDDVSTTLARVIDREPEWDTLPTDLKPVLARFLRSCLIKNPKQRVHDVADLRLAMDGAFDVAPVSGSEASSHAGRRERVAWIAAAAFAVTSIALLLLPQSENRQTDRVRLSLVETRVRGGFALSPDGRQLVYSDFGADGVRRLWVRSVDAESEARPLNGTDGATYPFWSPDGQTIGFFAARLVKKVPASGGAVQTLCDGPAEARGGTWSREGDILFAGWAGPLRRVSEDGGAPSVIRDVDSSRGEENVQWPWFLPDGEHYLYQLRKAAGKESGIYVASLSDPIGRRLLDVVSRVEYAAPGFLVYRGQDGFLMAQRFDAEQRVVSGAAEALTAEAINTPYAWAAFSTSPAGVMAYRRVGESGNSENRLLLVDREGAVIANVGSPQAFWTAQLSPDGTRVAANPGSRDIWIYGAETGTGDRFTTDSELEAMPVWSPDGERLAFFSMQRGGQDIYVAPVNESAPPELLVEAEGSNLMPTDWSADGQLLAMERQDAESVDLWGYSFDDGSSFPIVDSEFNEGSGTFSSDGRWLAYESDEAGTREVYVRAFPGPGRAQRISQGGGRYPKWRHDGAELYYLTPAGQLMAVEIDATGVQLDVSGPAPLFQMDIEVLPLSYDVAADGNRFLVIERNGVEALTVVTGWFRELTDRIPVP